MFLFVDYEFPSLSRAPTYITRDQSQNLSLLERFPTILKGSCEGEKESGFPRTFSVWKILFYFILLEHPHLLAPQEDDEKIKH